MKEKLINYSLLISRMTPKQLYYRFIKIIKFKLIYPKYGNKLYHFNISEKNEKNRASRVNPFFLWEDFKENEYINEEYGKSLLESADEMYNDEFTFLNIPHKFKNKSINWSTNVNQDKLWLYYLNYFDYLLVFIESYHITNNKKYIFKCQKLIDDWIDSTKPGQENSWEAYTISIRLINWSYLWEVLRLEDIEIYKGFKKKFISSIEQQAKFLYNNLEKDLANNHYTANGKALFWIGITFPNMKHSNKYFKIGINILQSQLLKEMREDGSQYENSTSYQLMTAKDYIEILIYADKNNISLPKEFYHTTEKMFDYIVKMLKPDRNLPLLNDSAKEYPILAGELLALGSIFFNRGEFKFGADILKPVFLFKIYGDKGKKSFLELVKFTPQEKSVLLNGSNYIIFRSGWNKNSKYLLFDAGDIGPKHNAGHAHADNLSIYLHLYGEDIFIDPGTYEYKAGYRRDYYRSTSAHNTIEMEGENQSTFWGPFRVGYKADTKLIQYETSSTTEKAVALHDGYKRLKQKIVHSRKVEWDKNNIWIITDKINGNRSSYGKLNFQIGVTCMNTEVFNNMCILEFENSIINIKFSCVIGLSIAVEKSMMSEKWKEEIEIKKIVVSFEGKLPIEITTQIESFKK